MVFWKRKKNKQADTSIVEESVQQRTDAAIDLPDDEASVAATQTPSSEPATAQLEAASELVPEVVEEPAIVEQPVEKKGLFSRMRAGLSRSSERFTAGMADLLLGKKEIDDDLIEDLETQLLTADVGVDATQAIIDGLTERITRRELSDANALYEELQQTLKEQLAPASQPLVIDTSASPFVILVVGVNGVGKTTTIGKMAKQFQRQGHSVMLAAGDTFRAAAVEQLKVWGERNDVPVIAQATGADSASVIYDALQSAKSRNIDILIADTAGRLQNKSNLMDELSKVRRVMGKIDDAAPHEVLLVLDAGTGQNAISQAETFKEAAGVTGLALTKLDGTAKGGIAFTLTERFKLPMRYIGVGEQIDDLQTFSADHFVDALFAKERSE